MWASSRPCPQPRQQHSSPFQTDRPQGKKQCDQPRSSPSIPHSLSPTPPSSHKRSHALLAPKPRKTPIESNPTSQLLPSSSATPNISVLESASDTSPISVCPLPLPLRLPETVPNEEESSDQRRLSSWNSNAESKTRTSTCALARCRRRRRKIMADAMRPASIAMPAVAPMLMPTMVAGGRW